MLIINCPYCGPREESEFACGGEAHIARPLAENTLTTGSTSTCSCATIRKACFWKDGATAGCRRWFNVARTVTHEIIEVYPMGACRKLRPETHAKLAAGHGCGGSRTAGKAQKAGAKKGEG